MINDEGRFIEPGTQRQAHCYGFLPTGGMELHGPWLSGIQWVNIHLIYEPKPNDNSNPLAQQCLTHLIRQVKRRQFGFEFFRACHLTFGFLVNLFACFQRAINNSVWPQYQLLNFCPSFKLIYFVVRIPHAPLTPSANSPQDKPILATCHSLHIRFNPDFLAYKATLTNGPLPTLGQVQTESLLLQQGDLIYTQQKSLLFQKKNLSMKLDIFISTSEEQSVKGTLKNSRVYH